MRKELSRALWEAVLAVRDGKGWPLSDRVPAKPTIRTTSSDHIADALIYARAGKTADRIKRLREYAAQNPHARGTVEAEIQRLKRGK